MLKMILSLLAVHGKHDHYCTWFCLDQSHVVFLLFNECQDYAQYVYDFQVCFLQILCTFRPIVLMYVLIHKHVQ